MAAIQYDCDIDFFNELKQMKCAAPASVPAPLPRCLITDEPLRKDHITLRCGHKFNYVPLFKEVLFQKCSLLPKNLSTSIVTMYTKHTTNTPISSLPVFSSAAPGSVSSSANLVSVTYNSSYNLETTKLQYNEIKCPYCRTITPHILPYYPYPEVCKVKYVNMPPNLAMPGLSCEYRQSSTGKPKSSTTDDDKACKNGCIYSEKYDMMLCNKHLTKQNTELKVAPCKAKKHATATSHDDPITTDAQNVIVSHHNPATSVCSFLLLSGPRKGTPCGKPMWIPKTVTVAHATLEHPQNAYCKAHWGK